MSVDFATVSLEEVRLVDAIFAMADHYSPKDNRRFSPLDAEIHELLCEYGLIEADGTGFLFCASQYEEMGRRVAESKRSNPSNLFSGHNTSKSANDRSAHILRLLAQITQRHLSTENGEVYHYLYGEGERAIHELNAYGLLMADEAGLGRWTNKGIRVLG